MNGITILIWITIALIAAIAIIAVKLHYKGDELEHQEGSILPGTESLNGILSVGKNRNNTNNTQTNTRRSLSPQTTSRNLFRKETNTSKDDAYIVPEVKSNNIKNFEYESQNQVLINYDNTVEKFQEPIKQSQMDIMTQNTDKETTELKDLFTIDELIKESKRKDSEREKESQKLRSAEEDKELEDIKESIKNRKENKAEEPLIEEIISEDEDKKEETIGDLIADASEEEEKAEEQTTLETVSVASQKDIDEVIDSASKEVKEEIETIAANDNITDVLLDQEEKEQKPEEITEPALKTPVEKTKDYKMGASIDDANLFGDDNEDEGMDLDYRKDLDRFANKIKGSKLFQDVKEKLTPDTQEEEITPREPETETYIRTVNTYDEYEPIINETHIDFEEDEDYDQRLREANTRRIMGQRRTVREPEYAQPRVGTIKDKPARDNIKIQLNNSEVVLKKGDEIIFNHAGETYSSQVFAINGDDISVKYRRKNIKIKPSDVKKIY